MEPMENPSDRIEIPGPTIDPARTTTDAGDGLRSDAFIAHAMRCWGDDIFRLAYVQTRSRTAAEDVYQDVFLRLAMSATAFRDDEHLKAWLLRVTINRSRDYPRSDARRRTSPLETLAVEPSDSRGDVPSPENMDLWDAIGKLPEQMRTAVHLHYFEGYGEDEIAEMLGVNPSTLRNRLCRARRRLRKTIGGRDETGER